MFTLLVLSSASYAATLTVDPSDAAAYATIHDAIDAASRAMKSISHPVSMQNVSIPMAKI